MWNDGKSWQIHEHHCNSKKIIENQPKKLKTGANHWITHHRPWMPEVRKTPNVIFGRCSISPWYPLPPGVNSAVAQPHTPEESEQTSKCVSRIFWKHDIQVHEANSQDQLYLHDIDEDLNYEGGDLHAYANGKTKNKSAQLNAISHFVSSAHM